VGACEGLLTPGPLGPLFDVAEVTHGELDGGHPLTLVLGELATARVARLTIPPLSERTVGELAAPHDIDAAELHRQTSGNPFYVTEVLAAGTSEIPHTVRDAVLARLARLSAPATPSARGDRDRHASRRSLAARGARAG
jgi:hypothetical protein